MTAAAVEELDRYAAAGEEDGFGDNGGSYITGRDAGQRVGGTTSNFQSAAALQHK